MKIIGYCRVSTDAQSVKSQVLKIRTYAKQHKMKIDKFIEVNKSGDNNKASDKDRKIDELRQLKKGDVIIVTELSRLGRTQENIIKLYIDLKENGVSIIFTNQPELNTNGSFSLALMSIMAYFAETDRILKVEAIKAGLDNAKAKGKILGRKKGAIVKLKLEDRKKEVLNDIANGLTKTFISQKYNVSRTTLDRFLKKVSG